MLLLTDGFWLNTKSNARKLQGRLNDIGMLVAVHAQRDAATGKFSAASRELLEDVARWTRLYNMARAQWSGRSLHTT